MKFVYLNKKERQLWNIIPSLGDSGKTLSTARRFNFEKAQPMVLLDWFANLPLVMLFILSFFPVTFAEIGNPYGKQRTPTLTLTKSQPTTLV